MNIVMKMRAAAAALCAATVALLAPAAASAQEMNAYATPWGPYATGASNPQRYGCRFSAPTISLAQNQGFENVTSYTATLACNTPTGGETYELQRFDTLNGAGTSVKFSPDMVMTASAYAFPGMTAAPSSMKTIQKSARVKTSGNLFVTQALPGLPIPPKNTAHSRGIMAWDSDFGTGVTSVRVFTSAFDTGNWGVSSRDGTHKCVSGQGAAAKISPNGQFLVACTNG